MKSLCPILVTRPCIPCGLEVNALFEELHFPRHLLILVRGWLMVDFFATSFEFNRDLSLWNYSRPPKHRTLSPFNL